MGKKKLVIILICMLLISFIATFIPYPLPKGMQLSFSAGGTNQTVVYTVHFGRFMTVATSEGVILPEQNNILYTARTTYLGMTERKRLLEKVNQFKQSNLQNHDGMVAGGAKVRFSLDEKRHFSGDMVSVKDASLNGMLYEITMEFVKCAKPFPVPKGWKELYKSGKTRVRPYVNHSVISLAFSLIQQALRI